MLTHEFIAGYVSAFGSFLETTRNYKKYFSFQIKSSITNKSLLDQIATTIGLDNQVYSYSGKSQSYSLLIVRDRHSLLKKVIPYFDGHLLGEKEARFVEWKAAIIKNSSTWNYQNIKGTINPQLYRVVDNNPNNKQINGG